MIVIETFRDVEYCKVVLARLNDLGYYFIQYSDINSYIKSYKYIIINNYSNRHYIERDINGRLYFANGALGKNPLYLTLPSLYAKETIEILKLDK